MPTLLKAQNIALSPNQKQRRANGFRPTPNAVRAHPLGFLSVAAYTAAVKDQGCFVCSSHDQSMGDDLASVEGP